jgi:hypothetical protein
VDPSAPDGTGTGTGDDVWSVAGAGAAATGAGAGAGAGTTATGAGAGAAATGAGAGAGATAAGAGAGAAATGAGAGAPGAAAGRAGRGALFSAAPPKRTRMPAAAASADSTTSVTRAWTSLSSTLNEIDDPTGSGSANTTNAPSALRSRICGDLPTTTPPYRTSVALSTAAV